MFSVTNLQSFCPVHCVFQEFYCSQCWIFSLFKMNKPFLVQKKIGHPLPQNQTQTSRPTTSLIVKGNGAQPTFTIRYRLLFCVDVGNTDHFFCSSIYLKKVSKSLYKRNCTHVIKQPKSNHLEFLSYKKRPWIKQKNCHFGKELKKFFCLQWKTM